MKVSISREVLEQLISMAESHVDDIESGIDEGLYDAKDNEGLDGKQAAIATARSLLAAPVGFDLETALSRCSNFEKEAVTHDFLKAADGKIVWIRDDYLSMRGIEPCSLEFLDHVAEVKQEVRKTGFVFSA